MAEQVIVVPEGTEAAADTATAFAAGVATAEAAQAGEDAAEAAAVAEVAAEEAGAAVAIAAEASATSWAAREDVEQLRAELGAGLDEIRGMIADLAVGGAEPESELTPERIEREEGPGPEEEHDGQEPARESKSAGRYGNPRWFSR